MLERWLPYTLTILDRFHCIVNGGAQRMGKGATVLLVTLTCVALLPRYHSQGEVRVTECKGCTL